MGLRSNGKMSSSSHCVGCLIKSRVTARAANTAKTKEPCLLSDAAESCSQLCSAHPLARTTSALKPTHAGPPHYCICQVATEHTILGQLDRQPCRLEHLRGRSAIAVLQAQPDAPNCSEHKFLRFLQILPLPHIGPALAPELGVQAVICLTPALELALPELKQGEEHSRHDGRLGHARPLQASTSSPATTPVQFHLQFICVPPEQQPSPGR